jgi:Holliday junction resolvase
MSSRKGDRWERNYRNVLSAATQADFDDANTFGISDFDFVRAFTAVRMPTSGGGVTFDLPDLHVWFVSNGGAEVRQYAVEVKAGRDRVSFRKDDGDGGIPALRRYAKATGAEPIAFVHIDYTGDFVVHADGLHESSKSHTFTKARDVGRDDVRDFAEWVESPR